MKKRYILIAVLCLVMALSVVFAACNEEPKHEHTYSESWSSDENYHWHPATCEHTDAVSGKSAHTPNAEGLCSVCNRRVFFVQGGFQRYVYASDGGEQAKVMPDVPAVTEPTLAIHYYRKNAQTYKTWGFWVWADGAEGVLVNIQYQDNVGSVTLIPLADFGGADAEIGLIPRAQADWTKDGEADRFLVPSDYTFENNCYHVYIVEGDINLYRSIDETQYLINAQFTDEQHIDMTFSSPIKRLSVKHGETVLNQSDLEQAVHIGYDLPDKADLSSPYTIEATFVLGNEVKTASVNVMKLYDTETFADNFTYDGKDLGAVLGTNSTTFKVWSPVSTQIVLNIYDAGVGGEATAYEMVKGEQGIWSYTANERLAGKYYTYTVYNSAYPDGAEIVDPYAKSAGLSGKRGMVVDFDSAEATPDGWSDVTPHAYKPNELVVWETHVADVTSSATWGGTPSLAKTFKGMIEGGTTYQKGNTTVKTGFDHIVELGVNAVQLVPVFDQANDESNMNFNWGYNPLNYNVIEGGYSTDASDGYVRVKEFRELVQAFNGQDINIIMDVVYNHMGAATGSNFDVLCPGYYFRYNSSGSMYNGSGCGNETASERPMMRKFMIDSVCFLAETYKLGGFRFDLMGLHDLDTMQQLTAALKEIDSNIIVYGEPWTGGTSGLESGKQATQANMAKFEGYGQFNDQMRDALIKGGMNSADKVGWVALTSGFESQSTRNDEVTKIVNGLKGITGLNVLNIQHPVLRTVNYVTCHDNYTLKDRIQAIGKSAISANAKKSAMLANSVVLTSNGITFMLAGEEFLRSKGDLATDAANDQTDEAIHNSYQSSYEMNSLNYELKVDNADMFENYRQLIAFKRMFVSEFGLEERSEIEAKYDVQASDDGMQFVVTITAKDGKVWKVAHGNGVGTSQTVDFAGYTLYLDTMNTNVALSGSTKLAPFQTLIAYK